MFGVGDFWGRIRDIIRMMKSVSKIKTKLRQLNYKTRHDLLTVENVVLFLAIVLCLVWTYQSVAAMSRNWELSERLTSERKTLELLRNEVEVTKMANEYYKTDEYQELVARKNLDKKLNGENMVVMPENSEEAKNKHKEVSVATKLMEEKEYSNFEKWMMYLFPNY
jgi:hypothetical protein